MASGPLRSSSSLLTMRIEPGAVVSSKAKRSGDKDAARAYLASASSADIARRPLRLDLRLLVIREPDLVDQVELRLEPVDVILFGGKDRAEELPAHIIAGRLAIDDRCAQRRMSGHL